MSSDGQAVAVLGLGIMGAPFARNLGQAGLRTRAWNRSPEPRHAIVGAAGVILAKTPSDAVRGAGVVVSMLSDGAATLEVIGSVVDALAPNAVVVQMATIGVEATAQLAAMLAGHRPDVALVDAPVSGTKGPAEAGTVTIFASGPSRLAVGELPGPVAQRHPAAAAIATGPAADVGRLLTAGADPNADPAITASQRELLAAVFGALGRRTVWLGEAGAGTRMKLVVNALLTVMTHGLAEAVMFAQTLGVEAEELSAALTGAPIASPFINGKLAKFAARDFRPEMSLRWGAKDAGLALAANLDAGGQPMPVLETVEAVWQAAVEAGLGRQDISALLTHLESDSPR